MALHYGCWLALTGAVLAQGSPPVQGLLRDPSGDSVVGAEVQFLPEPVPAVLALTGAVKPIPAVATTSDERGVFRIAATGTGTVFTRTARGLGAIALHCQSGRAVRLVLEPMGELSVGGSEVIQAWPAAIDAEGRRHHMPMQRGSEIRLPSGIYEIWCDLGEAFTWQRVTLRSGQRTLLQRPTEAITLTVSGTNQITPLAFPHAVLATEERPKLRLLGDARWATLMLDQKQRPLLLPFRGTELPAMPSVAETMSVRVATGTEGACAWLLDRVEHAEPRVLACAPADREGRCHLPKWADHAEAWLLVTAPGRAPHAERYRTDRAPSELALPPGRTVQCQVTRHDGLPAVGVAVDFVPHEASPATLRARTDDRGVAIFVHLDGQGELRIDDPSAGTSRRELTNEVAVAMNLDEGAVVEGQVVDESGAGVAFVTIQLRDPTAKNPRERAATSDQDGRFRFAGLTESQAVVLFAQQVRRGITWSGRTELAAPKRSVFVVLSNEDPKLERGNGR
jgi:hypothetical protein